jgi:polar amino acid transport system substrate-binding protein
VLSKNGTQVEFVFFPWIQSQKKGGERSFTGYFPAWKEEVLPGFRASRTLFTSPVVFVENKDRPLKWEKLEDLAGKTFGVTAGYGNTKEFNELVAKKTIKVETVLAEETLFRKLVNKEIDGILIDSSVALYYLTVVYPEYAKVLQLESRVIENKSLHFAFNGYSTPRADFFNKILKTVEFQEEVESYLKKHGKESSIELKQPSIVRVGSVL